MTSPQVKINDLQSGSLMLLITAALSGAAVMVIELAAVRLIAPWFGTSLTVWSNVIAVVLLGLAIGYLLGARLSRGDRPAVKLLRLLAIGALSTSLAPLLAAPVAQWLVPNELNLDRALGVFRWGSLATALCLFLLPATVLGGVGPLVVELVSRAGKLHAGDAGGRVLFSSTAGSLVGVFGTSYWAVPTLGIRGTFFMATGLLALAAFALYMGERSRLGALGSDRFGTLLLFLIAAGTLVFEPTEANSTRKTLAVVDSLYQRVRVLDAPEEGKRFLQVNEVSNSFQSVWQAKPGLLEGSYYYNDFVLPAWWSESTDGAPRKWRVLCIGMGAGTAKRVMETSLPKHLELAFEGIELDPVILELGREWCGLKEGPNDQLVGGLDGRAAARLLKPGFDQIIIDAYANQIEIPAHLITLEFFEELEDLLLPGGWLQINAPGGQPTAPLVQAIAATLVEAFQSPVLILQVPATRNLVLQARRQAAPPVPASPNWIPNGMAPKIQALLRGRAVRGQFDWVSIASPKGRIFTDDLAPIETLELKALEDSFGVR